MTAHKTAISRKKLSAPAAKLQALGLLRGRVLDYGCGRGGDAERLGAESYDPFYQPRLPAGTFDTILCSFVLNVVENERHRRDILLMLDAYLKDDGRAYIAVRNDKKALTGYTKLGTWQAFIELDLPVVASASGYTVYELTKGKYNCEMRSTVFAKR